MTTATQTAARKWTVGVQMENGAVVVTSYEKYATQAEAEGGREPSSGHQAFHAFRRGAGMSAAFKVLKQSTLEAKAKPGTLVYRYEDYDYGVAADDTAMTGIEHVSVTLHPGVLPFFTMPRQDIELLDRDALRAFHRAAALDFSVNH